MGTDTGRVQANAGGRRIPMSVDLNELNQVAALIPKCPIVRHGGFTLCELMGHLGLGRTATGRRISDLIASSQVEFVGYRQGPAREKVYKTVAPAEQGEYGEICPVGR